MFFMIRPRPHAIPAQAPEARTASCPQSQTFNPKRRWGMVAKAFVETSSGVATSPSTETHFPLIKPRITVAPLVDNREAESF